MMKHQNGPCHQVWQRWKLLISFFPQLLHAKFVANGSNVLRGVGKSKFLIFHRALAAHGEVVTWDSCHSDKPMLRIRYPTLCALSKMHRKLLFNNLGVVWNIKIIFITFWQVWRIFQVWWVLGYVQAVKNAIILDEKVVIRKAIGTSLVETCSGPN